MHLEGMYPCYSHYFAPFVALKTHFSDRLLQAGMCACAVNKYRYTWNKVSLRLADLQNFPTLKTYTYSFFDYSVPEDV